MNIIGFDLGKRKSQVCILDKEGKVLVEQRICTTPAELTAFFGTLQGTVLMESSTSSRWVAAHLRTLGLTVVVGDPRFTPMYAQADKRVKTDKRDARALALALKLKAFRAAHEKSANSVKTRQLLLARSQVVSHRAHTITMLRSLCECWGHILPACTPEGFVDHVKSHAASSDVNLAELMQPLLKLITQLNAHVVQFGKQLIKTNKASHVQRHLDSMVGVGPVTAAAFATAIDEVGRFTSAKQVAGYLGLVPRENSSGERRQQGGITKAGDTLTRAMLVQASWTIMRSKRNEVAVLRQWAHNVALRRGKQRAVVALARRLSRILFAMWRDDKPYDEHKVCAHA
jgi:transposase